MPLLGFGNRGGSKESHGLRGRECVLPTVRELIEEGGRHPPPCKVTVQVSEKGMKIIQTVPALSSRTGKLKMETVKLVVASHSITYSLIGPQPYSDVVSCILLLWNPETRCPVHIHVYRCDSPETASVMHTALQMLVDKPANQRALMDVERRLMARGLLVMRRYQTEADPRMWTEQYPCANMQRKLCSNSGGPLFCKHPAHNVFVNFRIPRDGYSHVVDHWKVTNATSSRTRTSCPTQTMGQERDASAERVSRLHQAMFSELKEKLQSSRPLLLPPKDYTLRFVKSGLPTQQLSGNETQRKYQMRKPIFTSSSSTVQSVETTADPGETRRKFRAFGDTLRTKTDDSKSDRRLDQFGGHSLSTSSICAMPSTGTETGISYDQNWLITRPRSSTMQDINWYNHNDLREVSIESGIATASSCSNQNSASVSDSSPPEAYRRKVLQRLPNQPVVCDPFGRKYERRTTVKNFWKDVQMPTKIEDNYGLWYLAPSDHCFP